MSVAYQVSSDAHRSQELPHYPGMGAGGLDDNRRCGSEPFIDLVESVFGRERPWNSLRMASFRASLKDIPRSRIRRRMICSVSESSVTVVLTGVHLASCIVMI
jgi:hypothetical protein